MPAVIKQNDTRPVLELHLTRTVGGSEGPLDLTDADSAKLLMKQNAVSVSRAVVVTDAANGVVQVTFQAADTAIAGVYQAEVEITWAAGEIETVPNDGYETITIKADLG